MVELRVRAIALTRLLDLGPRHLCEQEVRHEYTDVELRAAEECKLGVDDLDPCAVAQPAAGIEVAVQQVLAVRQIALPQLLHPFAVFRIGSERLRNTRQPGRERIGVWRKLVLQRDRKNVCVVERTHLAIGKHGAMRVHSG